MNINLFFTYIKNGDIMLIRLGYVAISKTIGGITSSSTITVANFNKNKDYDKLDKVIISNLKALIEILKYNIANNIYFYRITSNLIPLATFKEISFDYIKKYTRYYKEISTLINCNNLRVDMHPGQFCVLNSTKKEVVDSSIDILEYHYKLMSAFNIDKKILILHVGGSTFGKDKSITRFINNFKKLPNYLQECIAIENDDKIFDIEDCLKISSVLNIPIVLDYHHYLCNNNGSSIEKYLSRIFVTWKSINPKIHFSSPKNKKEYRHHHDYIDSSCFIEFLNILKKYDYDVDIMIEAKAKDEAMFKLIRELKYKTNYYFINDTSFKI